MRRRDGIRIAALGAGLTLCGCAAERICMLPGPVQLGEDGWYTSHTGLRYRVLTPGDGKVAGWNDAVTVDESTSLTDGTLIFSTWDTGQPISFTLGGEQVIDGLEELLVGMREGERREAVMPPRITRRERYPDSFGPEDTLRFVVELLRVTPPAMEPVEP